MRFGKKVSVELKGDALEAHNELNRVVGEQKARRLQNSEEIALWNSIQRAFGLIAENPLFSHTDYDKRFGFRKK